MLTKMFQRLEELYPDLVEFRREMHKHPELSFKEVHTPKKIAEFLTGLGLDVRTDVGGRGVVARLKGGKPGKTIALRADFDALPIQDKKEVEYKSTVPNVMHACGHDIHTSSLLGAAKVLAEFKDELPGNIVFIHQFAEEQIPGGALSMIADGCLDGVDVIYGSHVWSSLPVGTIGIIEEFAMAAGDRFDIEIYGKGGHGAKPHITVDSVHVGTQIINQLHHIVSRSIDPLKAAVVTVGEFHAGQAFNVIADQATISGTVRTFDAEVRDSIENSIKQIATSVSESAGGKAEVNYERGYPSLWNHPDEIKRAEIIAKKLVGEENVKHLPPSMGMEDFAYYVKEIPGAFIFVGGGNPEIKAEYPHHHPMFDVDERSILQIGKMFLSIVMNEE